MAKKMRLKMKKRSSRYDINRPRRWYGHKYTKYKICIDIMMVISFRQHLSYIWSLIHEKVKQHWPRRHRTSWTSSERLMYGQFTPCVYEGDWFLKSVAYKKSYTSSLAKFSVFSVSYHYAFLRDKYVSRNFAITFEKISHKRFYCMIAALSNCKHLRWICELKHLVNKD